MVIPFPTERAAAMKLKNNKSPGSDNIIAEMVRSSPDIAYQNIAKIFNHIAETCKAYEDLYAGILVPLQKPDKERGKEENLRSIILLNIIRKIRTIALLNRI